MSRHGDFLIKDSGGPYRLPGALGELDGCDGVLSLGPENGFPQKREWEKGCAGRTSGCIRGGNDPRTPVHTVYGLKEGGAETVSVIGNHHMGQSPYGFRTWPVGLYEWVRDWYAEDFCSAFSTILPSIPWSQ